MRLHVFFSVHERVFGPIAEALRTEYGVENVSGFVWGADQQHTLEREGIRVDPLTVYTRDVLARLDNKPADVAYLSSWEQRCGVPLQHMIFAERHLQLRYSYDRLVRLAELTFRRVEEDFDRTQADAYFSEDVACLTSYIHWAVAKHRGLQIVLMNNARLPRRVTTYSNPYQQWDLLEAIFPDTPPGALTSEDLAAADTYIKEFRNRPAPPTGLLFRSRLNLGNRFDLSRLTALTQRWFVDAQNPTLRSPTEVVMQRGRRLARSYLAQALRMFDSPSQGERYVLYPLHYQPEATTLVLAPYYLNQLALIEDIAKSLPAGHRLYVKEHVVSRGRWPLEFYAAIRRVPGVRLLSPEEDTYTLLRNAAAIAVITGTMGWEALLLDKPSITFGRVFYNRYPLVHRAGEVAKQDWPELFRKAIFAHRVDHDLLRRFVACAFKATFPGLTGNPGSLPEILEPDNIRKLITVVATALGLHAAPPRAKEASWSA